MSEDTFLIVDQDSRMRQIILGRFQNPNVCRAVGRACEYDGTLPENSWLFVRDLERQINGALLYCDHFETPPRIVAYGFGPRLERLLDLRDRGVVSYYDLATEWRAPDLWVYGQGRRLGQIPGPRLPTRSGHGGAPSGSDWRTGPCGRSPVALLGFPQSNGAISGSACCA